MSDEYVTFTDTGTQPFPVELAKALVAAWAELGNLPRGKTANAGTYSYQYSDLGDLLDMARPILAKHGLALLQPITRDGGATITIETCLLHSSGERMSWPFVVAATGSPQQIGSAITYGRRYSAQAALGVASEDDDGQAAAKQPPPVQEQPTVRPPAGPSPEQTRKAMALFGDLELGGRTDRLAVTSAVLGRDVGSWADVTPREAGTVIDALEQMRADAVGVGVVIAVPTECDTAVLALKDALAQLHNAGAPLWVFEAFERAHATVRDCLSQVKTWNNVSDVEVRHIDSQLFPWVNDE